MPLALIVREATPISSRIRTGEVTEGDVLRTLDGMVMRLLAVLNLKGTMNDEQVEICVKDIYEKFPNETLEDFAQVFKRARQGEYGVIYRIDQPTIFGWIYAYLETKAEALQRVPREQPFTLADLPDDKLEEIKRAVAEAPMMRPGVPMSKAEVRREGQVRPKREAAVCYPYSPLEIGDLQDLKVQYGRLHTDKLTGKPLEGAPSWEEFYEKNKNG